MTAPQVPLDSKGPINPAKAKLDAFIAEWDQGHALTAQTLHTLVTSGLADSLMQVTGPQKFSAPDRYPVAFSGGDWGNSLATNDMGGHIAFRPGFLQAESGATPLDRTFNERDQSVAQVLSHEMGHSAQHLPGLYPDSVPTSEGSEPKSLIRQWSDVITAKKSVSSDVVENLTHGTWWTDSKGEQRPGRDEQFADTFAEAVNHLRKSWDPTDRTKTLQGLSSLEKSYPGITYVTRFLVSKPPYEQHPIAKALKASP